MVTQQLQIYFDLCDTCFKLLPKLLGKHGLQYDGALHTFEV